MPIHKFGVFNLDGALSRVYGITVTAYFLGDMAIWDARVYYQCPCCLSTTWAEYYNITFERVAHLRRLSYELRRERSSYTIGFVSSSRLDSYLRFQEDEIGAYAFNNYGIYWMNYPIPTLIAEDMRMSGVYLAQVLSETEIKKKTKQRAVEALRGIKRQHT